MNRKLSLIKTFYSKAILLPLELLGVLLFAIGKSIIYVLWLVVRTVVRPFRFVAGSKGRTRTRLVLVAVFFVAFLLGNFLYPKYWNQSADRINPKIDSLKSRAHLPAAIAKIDTKGVLSAIGNKIYVNHFYEVPFSLGLDLQGGTHLVYEADTDALKGKDPAEAMAGIRDIIERRVNSLGVREPLVQVKKTGDKHRLIVELAGVYNTNEAIKSIGATPTLVFKEERTDEEVKQIFSSKEFLQKEAMDNRAALCRNVEFIYAFQEMYKIDPCFSETLLNGQYLKQAEIEFDPNTNQPYVGLVFNDEGAKLFENITEKNIGKPLAIYIDKIPLSIPNVQQKIAGGKAQITGIFTVDEVKTLVRNLNAGALPVPINLVSQQTIGATLGSDSVKKSMTAAIWGAVFVAVFMILMYRLSGVVSVISLVFYALITLTVFKLLPVTMTLPGIGGFILSLGMAVDANVLVFERLRDEFRRAPDLSFSHVLDRAFERAWTSIRDGNISTLITCAILFWFSTSFVKGFALTLGIGILVSMFCAMVVTRHFLRWFVGGRLEKYRRIWTR
ncbi:MAG: protein translocase subunit SecD [Candidatus Spechtbacteria bacterium]|nr:protein translocase subunit SecD [Candidatus Spechtbacteria bacterium]